MVIPKIGRKSEIFFPWRLVSSKGCHKSSSDERTGYPEVKGGVPAIVVY
jgi:hypothetical protein